MSLQKKLRSLQYMILICSTAISAAATLNSFKEDEVYKAAIDKGGQASDWFTKRSGKTTSSDYYADICAYYGSCIFGDATENSEIYEYINGRYTRTNAIITTDIDKNSCGILPLHLYLHNGKTRHLKLGTDAADANISKDGHFRGAIDDMYMTGSLHVQAYRATKDKKYLDFCANYIVRYINALQQSNGLYQHGANRSKQYWGRGNGWAAAGTAELLQILPKEHVKYNEVVNGFKKHMKSLIDVQFDNGMWPQLLASTDSRNWEETSGTSMFIFALFTGIELGILDKETYLEPARKGWMAVIKYLSSDGKLGNIANGFWPKTGTADEYLTAKKGGAGDSHGTAGFIWAATSIIRYYNSLQTGIPRFSSSSSQWSVKAAGPVQNSFFDLRGRKIKTPVFNINGINHHTGIVIHSTSSSKGKMLLMK